MKYVSQINRNAHWLLRIALASVFLFHGYLKFTNLDGFANMLPISYTEVVFVALAETAGSLLLLIGGLLIHFSTLAGSSFLLWNPGSAALAVGFIWGLSMAGMFFYATLSIIWRKEDVT